MTIKQKFQISRNFPPLIVADISANHNQSLNQALAIVDTAADAGADAVKVQTYTPDTLTLDVHTGDFFIKNKKNPWKGNSLYHLYQTGYTPWQWHKTIFNRCQKRGLIYFSTPYDDFVRSYVGIVYMVLFF